MQRRVRPAARPDASPNSPDLDLVAERGHGVVVHSRHSAAPSEATLKDCAVLGAVLTRNTPQARHAG